MNMSPLWKFKIYRSWDEVEDPSFIREWTSLIECDADAHVFFHPSLVRAWVTAYRRNQNSTPMFCVAESDEVKIFMPLVLWRRSWKNVYRRMIVPVGFSEYDYHDPIVSVPRTPEIMRSFWASLEQQFFNGKSGHFDSLMLQDVRYPYGGARWEKCDEVCPYVNLGRFTDYNTYLATLKKNLRQDINRQKKRMAELGKLNYIKFSNDDYSQALECLSDFLKAHQRKWPNNFKVPGLHEEILKSGAQAGIIHFSMLAIEAYPVSWHFGFSYKNRFYYYMPAYNEDYSLYSPSKVHLSFLNEECFRQGITIFDYLRGSESYKTGWASDSVDLVGYSRDSDSCLSKLRLGLLKGTRSLKKSFVRG